MAKPTGSNSLDTWLRSLWALICSNDRSCPGHIFFHLLEKFIATMTKLVLLHSITKAKCFVIFFTLLIWKDNYVIQHIGVRSTKHQKLKRATDDQGASTCRPSLSSSVCGQLSSHFLWIPKRFRWEEVVEWGGDVHMWQVYIADGPHILRTYIHQPIKIGVMILLLLRAYTRQRASHIETSSEF